VDGVFARAGEGRLVFRETARLTTLDVAEVLAAIEPRVARLLERRDVGEGAEDEWEAQAPVLAGLASASVHATRGSGQRWADQVRAFDGDDLASGRCLARANGFSLHAGVVVPAGQRARLEQVCRYVLRPPVASDRLAVAADGRVLVTLRHGWADGTAVVALDPMTFLGRLAVLVPRPRINLLLYQGVLGARSAWRAEVVRLAVAPAVAEVEPVARRRGGDARHPRRWSALGRTDAPDVCVRRARVWTVWRPTPVDCAHRADGRDHPHPAPPRVTERGAGLAPAPVAPDISPVRRRRLDLVS